MANISMLRGGCASLWFFLKRRALERQVRSLQGRFENSNQRRGLFPASAPKEVRLYLVEQSVPDQAKSPSGWAVPFRAPVTLFGSFTDRARRLQLGSELGLATRLDVGLYPLPE